MKIEIPEGGQVADRPVSTDYVHTERGFGDFAGAVAKAGQAGMSIGEKVQAGIDKAKKDADTIAVTDAETGYQGDITTALRGDTRNEQPNRYTSGTAGAAADDAFNTSDTPTGFLYTRGLGAAEKSTATLDYLEKQRKERAKNLANDEQKQLFLARTGGMYEDAHRQVEGHVTQQRQVAADASVEARKDAALEALAKNPMGEDVGRLQAGPEGAMRQLALSGEDADAKVNKWRGKVADTRINALLSNRDWNNAEQVLNESSASLAPQTVDRFKEQIGKIREQVENANLANDAIESHRNPETGFVDSAKARMQPFKMEGMAPGQAQKVADLIDHRLGDEKKAEEQTIAEHAAPVWDQLFKERTLANVDPRMADWLQKNARKEWEQLEDRAAKYNALDHPKAPRAAGEHETDDERAALVELRADIVENPAKYASMSAEQFTTTWAPRLSGKGLAVGGTLFAGTKKADQQSSGDLSAFVTTTKSAIKNKKDQAEFSAAMGDRYRAFIEEKKRKPSPDELEQMRVSATTETVKKGLLWDSKQPAYKTEAEARKKSVAGQPPPPKPGKVQVTDPSGKKWNVDEAGLDAWLAKHPNWKR